MHAGIAWTSSQLHWHRDQATEAPPGARVLAGSQACPIQAWARGLRTYGFQYHPEVTPATIERWAAADPRDLDDAGITLEQLRTDTDRHYPSMERLSRRLFESIALFLAPADRRYEGLLKDLHH